MGFLDLFKSKKPPTVTAPDAPPQSDTTDQLKQEAAARKAELYRYLAGGTTTTGYDILRGNGPSRTGLNP